MTGLPAKYFWHELDKLFGEYRPTAHLPCFHCDEPEAFEIRFAFAEFGAAAHDELPSGTMPTLDRLFPVAESQPLPDPSPANDAAHDLVSDNLFMLRDYVLSGDTLKAAAIKAAGGIRALARKLGVRCEAIEQWPCVPAERLQAIAKITGLPQHVLRPDLFDVSAPQSYYATKEEEDEAWKWSHAWQLWLLLPYPPGFLPAHCCARRPRLALVANKESTP